MPINISGPFLKQHNIDQLHSKDCLSVQGKHIPLYSQLSQPDHFEAPESALFLAHDEVLPPWSINHVEATHSSQQCLGEDAIVHGSLEIMDKFDVHPWLNSTISIQDPKVVTVGLMNSHPHPITIPKGTHYRTLKHTCDVSEAHRFPWRISLISKPKRQPHQTSPKPSPFTSTSSSPRPSPASFPSTTPTASPPPLHPAPHPDKSKTDLPAFMLGPTTDTNYLDRLNFLMTTFQLRDNKLLTSTRLQLQAAELLLKYWDIFSFDGSFGKTDLIQHKIYTFEHPPINVRYRPINPALEDSLKKQLFDWMKHDVIEESSSPYNFGLVAVPKKNSSTRWCVDFRPLNKISKRDTFPIGNIEDNLARLAKSTVFSGLDGSGAFHVIPLAPESREKTAFSTPFGSFHFKRLPFGLANGPATYARLIKLVLQGIPTSLALPYLDDIVCHSPDLETHFVALDRIFQAHEKAGLKLQPSKCQLFQEEIDYLGHTISKEGIAPMRQYVKVVEEWPLPTTRQATRAFLGKMSYYRRFIPNFAAKARPLTDKLSQDGTTDKQQFEPSEEFKNSFEILKKALLEAPILAYPQFDSSEPFLLDTDWSFENSAIGGVLGQKQDGKERVIAYAAHKLNKHQQNYGPTKGELYAVIFFLHYWRYYLSYRPFILRTDHMALKYINSMEAPAGMIQRWLHLLSQYTFTVIHRAGKAHQNADALSRAPHLPPPDERTPPLTDESEDLVVGAVEGGCGREGPEKQVTVPLSTPILLQHQKSDPDISFLFSYISPKRKIPHHVIQSLSPTARTYAGLIDSLIIDPQGILRLQLEEKGERIQRQRQVAILPFLLIKSAIMQTHKQVAHKGEQATYDKLKLHAYFPRMTKHVSEVLKTCGPCQTKTTRLPDQKHTLGTMMQGYPFQKLSIDFVGPLPFSSPHGFQYLFTLKDCFTRWLEAFPIRRADAHTVRKILTSEIFPRFGKCTQIHSDRGTQFTGELMKELGDMYNITITQTPAYNPKSNSVERAHSDLKKALMAMSGNKPSKWPEHIPTILYAMRTTVNRMTGYSPFQLMFGREPIEDIDQIIPSPSYQGRLKTASEFFQELSRNTTQAYHLAREQVGASVARQRAQYHRTPKVFRVKDQVWLFTPILPNRQLPKFANAWSGPWEITRKINDLVYEVTYGDRREVVAIDRLRKYYPSETEIQVPPPPGSLKLEGDEFAEDIALPASEFTPDLDKLLTSNGGGPGEEPYPPNGPEESYQGSTTSPASQLDEDDRTESYRTIASHPPSSISDNASHTSEENEEMEIPQLPRAFYDVLANWQPLAPEDPDETLVGPPAEEPPAPANSAQAAYKRMTDDKGAGQSRRERYERRTGAARDKTPPGMKRSGVND